MSHFCHHSRGGGAHGTFLTSLSRAGGGRVVLMCENVLRYAPGRGGWGPILEIRGLG